MRAFRHVRHLFVCPRVTLIDTEKYRQGRRSYDTNYDTNSGHTCSIPALQQFSPSPHVASTVTLSALLQKFPEFNSGRRVGETLSRG